MVIVTVSYVLLSRHRPEVPRPAPSDAPRPIEQEVALAAIPRTLNRADDPRLTALIQRVDPASDAGWDTEVFAQGTQDRLDRLAAMLRSPATFSSEHVAEFSVAKVSCFPLRPHDLEEVFSDGSITVLRRPRTEADHHRREEATHVGHEGVAVALRDLFQPLRDASDIRVKCKVVGVDVVSDYIETTVYFQSSRRVGGGRTQQNAVWTCRWQPTRDAGLPMLIEIESNEYEEILSVGSRGIRFVDNTNAVLGETKSYRQQLWRGIDHWRSRLQSNYGVDPNGNQGIAIGDVNGDGLDDIYVCQQGGLPNRLYVRNRDGTLRDVSAEAGVDWMELTRSALLVDLDNDADQDLVICQGWYLLIMLNNGVGHFELASQHRCRGDAYSMAAADYDNDGDLDLFLCGRNPDPNDDESVGILGSPLPYHDANNGAPNTLWQNDGEARFRDVTKEVGLDQNNQRFSYAAAWADYDNDGDMDLYVANDFGRNNLYQNNGGRLSDVAALLGVEDISAGMSVTWGDYDGDGLLDLYVSNMFSSAGNRIAYQRQFRAGASAQSLGNFRRHARGNTLFRNAGSDGFQDVSRSSGVTMGRWAWGAKFVDLNNDSLEDLYVANGFITTEDTGDL